MWHLEQVHHVPGTIISLPKTGDLSDPVNYRGITLLSVLYKLYTSVLNRKLIKFAEGQQYVQCQQQQQEAQQQPEAHVGTDRGTDRSLAQAHYYSNVLHVKGS